MRRSAIGAWPGLGLVPVLVALLGGCVGMQGEWRARQAAGLPVRVELDDVPFHAQDAYQCGPAALSMVLAWSGLPMGPQALVSEVYLPARQGSLQTGLIAGARRHARIAYPVQSMDAVLAEVAAGHPVIVLQNLGLGWWPLWHYAVVIGYDLAGETVLLHSGSTSRERLSLRVFENTWARADHWGLVVLPPTRLPATAREAAYLEAVLGLERAGRWQAAAAGYETALRRWPASLVALMGLGNSRYALHDLAGAEAAFRQAARLHPHHGPAFNNLAHVLSERGKSREALLAARKAVTAGGPLGATYARTLDEIRSRAR